MLGGSADPETLQKSRATEVDQPHAKGRSSAIYMKGLTTAHANATTVDLHKVYAPVPRTRSKGSGSRAKGRAASAGPGKGSLIRPSS